METCFQNSEGQYRVPELCLMSIATLDHICNRFGRLLHDFNQPWLAPQQLEIFADKIHNKEPSLDNCSGFVDGTVRPVCRPGHRGSLTMGISAFMPKISINCCT